MPESSHEAPIPDKLYFKIGEVVDLVGVQAHVLRYWEKEIPLIRPSKSASNQRRYRYKDVETFREVKRLLHEERYTLAGAKKRLMKSRKSSKAEPSLKSSTSESVHTTQSNQDENRAASLKGSTLELPHLQSASHSNTEKLDRVRQGLNDLIELASEEI